MGGEVQGNKARSAAARVLAAERARLRGLVPGRDGADTRVANGFTPVLDKIRITSRGPQRVGRDRGRARYQSEPAGGAVQPSATHHAKLDGDSRTAEAAGS